MIARTHQKTLSKHVALHSNWIISGCALSSPLAKRLHGLFLKKKKSIPVKANSGFNWMLIC